MDAALDFVGDVRNDLDGFAQIFAFAFIVEDSLVDLAAGEIVEAGEFYVGEAFVMAEVEIGFSAIIQHVDFTVLIGAHCAGIDVEVRIEFLERDFESAIFEQSAERCSSEAFAKGTDHAAGYKDVFHY